MTQQEHHLSVHENGEIIQQQEPPFILVLKKIFVEIKQRWLLIAISFALLMAYFFPWVGRKGGPLKSEYTTDIAMAIIFFCSGFSMKAQKMISALKQWRLHLFIQCFSFGIFPVITFGITRLIGLSHFNQGLLHGLVILACTPTTIASIMENVVVTGQAEGNEAAALFNSALGNSIGVILSPSILYIFYTGVDIFAQVPIGSVFLNLFETVIAPLIVGQGVHISLLYLRIMKKEQPILNTLASILSGGLLIFILFCLFCGAFSSHVTITKLTLLATLGIVISIHFSMVSLVFLLSMPKFWKFSRADRVAALFCSPQKTLAIGVALMSSIFGKEPDVYVVVTIPLMMYHPVQIVTSGILVPFVRNWKRRESIEYAPVQTEIN